MKRRSALVVLAFAAVAGAIGAGVWADVREARLETLLSEIESAGERIPHRGVRLLKGTDTVALRVWAADGKKRVEFAAVRNVEKRPKAPRAPRVPFFGGMPVFLRPGHDQWQRRVKDVELAVRNYEVAVVGRETVAGRACDVVEVRSRHAGRPSYRVAADAENRFPLSFTVLSYGKPVFDTAFEEIEYRPAFPPGFFDEPARPQWVRADREELRGDPGFAVFRPAGLPRGFELRTSELFRVRLNVPEELREAARPFLPVAVADGEVPVVHLNYTDGLAVLSVVQCPSDSDLWKFLKRFIPGTGSGTSDGKTVARKFSDARGSAYLLELEGTVVLVAGNVAPSELEDSIRTLERR
jgi:hypothetical protein